MSASPARARNPALADAMVWIEGGRFRMGSDHHYPEEKPSRWAAVDGIWIDPRPVTNTDFARFV